MWGLLISKRIQRVLIPASLNQFWLASRTICRRAKFCQRWISTSTNLTRQHRRKKQFEELLRLNIRVSSMKRSLIQLKWEKRTRQVIIMSAYSILMKTKLTQSHWRPPTSSLRLSRLSKTKLTRPEEGFKRPQTMNQSSRWAIWIKNYSLCKLSVPISLRKRSHRCCQTWLMKVESPTSLIRVWEIRDWLSERSR